MRTPLSISPFLFTNSCTPRYVCEPYLLETYDIMSELLQKNDHDRLRVVNFQEAWSELTSFLPVLQRWALLSRPSQPIQCDIESWRAWMDETTVVHPLCWWALFLSLLFHSSPPLAHHTYRVVFDVRLDVLIELASHREHIPWIDAVLSKHTQLLIGLFWTAKAIHLDVVGPDSAHLESLCDYLFPGVNPSLRQIVLHQLRDKQCILMTTIGQELDEHWK